MGSCWALGPTGDLVASIGGSNRYWDDDDVENAVDGDYDDEHFFDEDDDEGVDGDDDDGVAGDDDEGVGRDDADDGVGGDDDGDAQAEQEGSSKRGRKTKYGVRVRLPLSSLQLSLYLCLLLYCCFFLVVYLLL